MSYQKKKNYRERMTVVDDETMNYILSEQEERDNQKKF